VLIFERSSSGVEYLVDDDLLTRGFLVSFLSRPNLSLLAGGDPGDAEQNRRLVASTLSLSVDRLTFAEQVHGSEVAVVDESTVGAGSKPGRLPIAGVDALVTTVADAPLVILTADCVPVVLVEPHAGVVAVAHAGWRGTLAGIVADTVEQMLQLGAGLDRIEARIGPAIGSCCYEVDSGLYDRFAETFSWPVSMADHRLDLAEINRLDLLELGIKRAKIKLAGICTACGGERFFSWRARRDSGRQGTIAVRL